MLIKTGWIESVFRISMMPAGQDLNTSIKRNITTEGSRPGNNPGQFVHICACIIKQCHQVPV